MVWNDDIEVSLKISGPFRLGSGKAGREVDLPVVKERLVNERETLFASNLAGSFRGVLRKSVHRMIHSANLSSITDSEEKIFGSWVTSERQSEGKLRVILVPAKMEPTAVRRTGIQVDEIFGSVAPCALFTFEALENEAGAIVISLILKLSFPLDDCEAAVLLAGLNGLLYDSIGGFASRGLGIIEEVGVDNGFRKYAGQELTRLLSKEER